MKLISEVARFCNWPSVNLMSESPVSYAPRLNTFLFSLLDWVATK